MKAPQKPSLDILVSPSVRLNCFYICLFVVIFTVLAMAPLVTFIRLSLLLATICSVLLVVRQLRFVRSVTSIHSREGGLSLCIKGKRIPVELLGNSVVSELMIVFSCRPAGAGWLAVMWPMQLVILSDSAIAEDRRSLRLLLKASALRVKS